MRILLWAAHRYPAGGRVGTRERPNERQTGGSCVVHDWLAKGLAELGHEVLYLLEGGADGPLPPGVTAVSGAVEDVDVVHHCNAQHLPEIAGVLRAFEARGTPWVATCHSDPRVYGWRGALPARWICVSRTLAESLGASRWVRNGVDPAELVYGETKEDYFLFLSNFRSVEGAHDKGLGLALELSRAKGFPLVVAGASRHAAVIDEVARLCHGAGARYAGDVRGAPKAELLARARALLFPTQINEAFGLVVAEALMAGTPVISSDRGACAEVLSPDVGFVCARWDDYLAAVDAVGRVSPRACRDRAMREFHYLRMAADYVAEYAREIEAARGRG